MSKYWNDLGAAIQAAGVVGEPEITLDPAALAQQVAQHLSDKLGKKAGGNTYTNKAASAAQYGFSEFYFSCDIDPKHVGNKGVVLAKYIRPAQFALQHGLLDAAGDGLLAFCPPSLLTKRRTKAANATVGNVVVACLLWWESPTSTIGCSFSVLARGPKPTPAKPIRLV